MANKKKKFKDTNPGKGSNGKKFPPKKDYKPGTQKDTGTGTGDSAGKDTGDRAPEGYETTRGTNALAWHTPDVELLRRAAAASWSYQTGEVLPMSEPLYGTGSNWNRKASQSGILNIRVLPSVGGAGWLTDTARENLNTSPTYNAANQLLTTMRSKARIRNTYDAPDVLMLNLAMNNIYAAVAFAKRLAATALLFTYRNRYLPEAMFRIQGFDPDWFKANQFQFVTALNILILEINKVYVPNRMHLFELMNERFSNYYTEGDSIKDQMYLFTPAFLSAIDYNSTQDYSSRLVPIMAIPGVIANGVIGNPTSYQSGALYTGETLLRAIRYMLNQVLQHDSTPDITGDMENCFGQTERFVLTTCDPNAVAVPIFDEEILETIHNASWCGAVTDNFVNYDQNNGIPRQFTTEQEPSTNRIGTVDAFPVSYTQAWSDTLESDRCICEWLDVHKDPNEEKTFAITRLKNRTALVTPAPTSNPTHLWANVKFTSDLICQIVFCYYNNNGTYTEEQLGNLVEAASAGMLTETHLQPFHYRPIRGLVDSNRILVQNAWWLGESDIFCRHTDTDSYYNMDLISLLTLLGAYDNVVK